MKNTSVVFFDEWKSPGFPPKIIEGYLLPSEFLEKNGAELIRLGRLRNQDTLRIP